MGPQEAERHKNTWQSLSLQLNEMDPQKTSKQWIKVTI